MSVVLVTALATTFIQLGYFLWKLSANHSQQLDPTSGAQSFKALLTDWRWVLGTCATTLGWVLFVYATSLGDISLVQPLMSAGDFILVVLAVLFLKERLSKYEWAGVVLTIAGAVALAWDPRGTELQAYSRIAFGVLVALTIAIGLALFLINKRSERPEVLLAPIVGLSFGLGAVLTKAMTANRLEAGKSAMDFTLLLDPFLLAVVVANAVGLILLQVAFRRGRASVIVPIQLALANAVTVIAGLTVFNESISITRWTGIVLIVIGTGLLQIKQRDGAV